MGIGRRRVDCLYLVIWDDLKDGKGMIGGDFGPSFLIRELINLFAMTNLSLKMYD